MILKKLGKYALIFTISTLMLTGCSNNEDAIASTNIHSLDKEAFTNEINVSRATYKLHLNEDLPDETLDYYAKGLAEQLAYLDIFVREGEKLKLSPSDKELDEQFKEIKEHISLTDGLQEILDEHNFTDEYIKERLYKSLTALAYEKHLMDNFSISNADLYEFYEKNKDDLYTSETFDAAHILLKTYSEDENGGITEFSEEEKSATKKKAEEILAKIKNGEDFNKLAKELSEDEGTKDSGGELGVLYKGETVSEFESAALSLEDGEVSDLVETEFGYHIIKLNKKDVTSYDFSSIQSYIRNDLLDSLLFERVDYLTEKYNLKINSDKIESLIKDLKPITLPEIKDDIDEEASNKEKDEENSDSDTSQDNTKENE